MSPLILVGRMSIPDHLEAKWNDAYNNERLGRMSIPDHLEAKWNDAYNNERLPMRRGHSRIHPRHADSRR